MGKFISSLNKAISSSKGIVIIILLFLVCTIFLFCLLFNTEHTVPDTVISFYNRFIEEYSSGNYSELASYIHYENPDYWMLEENDILNITDYHINKWEQINDSLWVVTVQFNSNIEPREYMCHHFIGYINDQLYIMIGVYQIPDSLSKGEDLSRYIPKAALSPGTTILK